MPEEVTEKWGMHFVQFLRAVSRLDRVRGLLFRGAGWQRMGLYIPRANWFHTCFMNHSIDCLWLNHGVIIEIKRGVKPWRVLLAPKSNCDLLELPDGTIKVLQYEEGDFVNFVNESETHFRLEARKNPSRKAVVAHTPNIA